MTTKTVPRRPVAEDLAASLDSREITDLIERLQATRWTGRPGYPIRTMIGMALAKANYALPTWTRTVALVREHGALAAVVAFSTARCPRSTRATALRASCANMATCSTAASPKS